MPTSGIKKERLIEIANAVDKRPNLMKELLSSNEVICECDHTDYKFGSTICLNGKCSICGQLKGDT